MPDFDKPGDQENALNPFGDDKPDWLQLVEESEAQAAEPPTPVKGKGKGGKAEAQAPAPTPEPAPTPVQAEPVIYSPDEGEVVVQALSVHNGITLVQWADFSDNAIIRRAELPSDLVILLGNGQAAVDRGDLLDAAPYGVAWEALITLEATPAMIAAELRRRGIWTYEDLFKNPQVALGAVQAAHRVDLAALIQAAREAQEADQA